MISLKSSTKINMPIEMVSQYVFDLKNSKKWFKNFIYYDLCINKDLRQGTSLYVRNIYFGTEFISNYKVLEIEKGRKLKLKGGFFLNSETTFFLEKINPTETKIIIRNKFKLYKILIPVIPLIKFFIHNESRKGLSNLKSIIEKLENINSINFQFLNYKNQSNALNK